MVLYGLILEVFNKPRFSSPRLSGQDYCVMIFQDRYYLIYAFPRLRWRILAGDLEGACEGLLMLLRGVQFPREYGRVTVVFDGARFSPGSRAAGLRVVFSRPPQKADEAIWDLLRSHAGERNLVVSGDRQVQSYARREDAAWEGPEAVRQRLETQRTAPTTKEKPEDISSAELERFLRLFGGGDEE